MSHKVKATDEHQQEEHHQDLGDQTETETEISEVDEYNPFAAPEIDEHEEHVPLPLDLVIVPKIAKEKRVRQNVDEEEVETDAEDDEGDEKNRNYFNKQVHYERPKWGKVWFTSAAMIAWSVGISNLTSFPVLVATQGGVAFIFAYLFVVIFLAFPMMYLEGILGQYFQTGVIGIWGLAPISRGLGPALFLCSFLVVSVLTSNTVSACWMMSEAMASIKSGLLVWTTCDNDWNTCICSDTKDSDCIKHNLEFPTNFTYSPTEEHFLGKLLKIWKTKYTEPFEIKHILDNGNWSVAYGFLNKKEGLGPLIPESCGILVMIYIFILVMNIVEFDWLGHFYSFTTIITIVVMALLLCRASTLEGAVNGLEKYFESDFGKLLDLTMWNVAYESAFFSLGSGAGAHILLNTFNKMDQNIRRDIILCIVVDFVISLMSCFIAFMLIGHIHHVKNTPIPDPIPGQNMVFIVLAECFSKISGSAFFAATFYFMIVLITIDTEVIAVCTLSYSLFEEFRRKYPEQEINRKQFLFSVWGFSFSLALVCSTRGGIWVYYFVLEYAFAQNTFIFMLVESVTCAWVWGIEEVCDAVEFINGKRPGIFLRICWKFILPTLLLTVLINTNAIVNHKSFKVYGQTVDISYFGVFLQLQAVFIPIGYAIYVYFRFRGCNKNRSCLQVLMLIISPEYEHESILADVHSAKRLHWKHYTFLMFDDELKSFHLKAPLQRAMQKVMKLKSRKSNTQSKPLEEVEPAPKKKKKKRNKDSEHHEEEETAWQLWDKIKKEEEEASTKVDSDTSASAASPTVKKKMRRKTVAGVTDRPDKRSRVSGNNVVGHHGHVGRGRGKIHHPKAIGSRSNKIMPEETEETN